MEAEYGLLLEQDGIDEACEIRVQKITEELTDLRKQRERIAAQLRTNACAQERVQKTTTALDHMDHQMLQWDEGMIRQLVHTVKVISADHITVYLNDGTAVEQEVQK